MSELIAQYPEIALVAVTYLLALAGWLAKMVAGRIGLDTQNGWHARLAHAARTAVLEQWQLYVADLRAARADGVLTAAEKATAKDRAWQRVVAMLGLAKLRRAFGAGMEAAIDAEIEAAVVEAKSLGLMTDGFMRGRAACVMAAADDYRAWRHANNIPDMSKTELDRILPPTP